MTTRLVPIALAKMLAEVVLPNPGGPLKRQCPSTSPRCLAAPIRTSSCSRTCSCPEKSMRDCGRNRTVEEVSGLSGRIRSMLIITFFSFSHNNAAYRPVSYFSRDVSGGIISCPCPYTYPCPKIITIILIYFPNELQHDQQA